MAEYIFEERKIEGLGALRGWCKGRAKVGEGGCIVCGCVGDVIEFVAELELYERLLEVVRTDGCEHIVGFWCSGDGASGTGWSRGHHIRRKGERDIM